MTDDPIDPKQEKAMRAIAKLLDTLLHPFGFALFVFEFGDTKRVNYISNAKREDMIKAMKEFIERHEGKTLQ